MTGTTFKLFKTLLAFAVAAMIGSFAPTALWSFNNSGGLPSFGTYFGVVIFSLCCLVIVGAPVQFIMQKFGWTGWLPALLAGATFGASVAFLIGQFMKGFYDDGDLGSPWALQWMMALGAAFGAIYALIAWLVRRPDKDRNRGRGAI